MKDQVLFSPKNNEKVFINVVCCSRDWLFLLYCPIYTGQCSEKQDPACSLI